MYSLETTSNISLRSYVVSKIAIVDFPDQWPDLLPAVLNVMPNGADAQLHGALRILQDLVEESLTDTQFTQVARDIINACHAVALNENRKFTHRSLAVLVFRSCFDLMDIVKDDNKVEVKRFAEDVLTTWLPFLLQVIQSPLPVQEVVISGNSQPQGWIGPIALKVQTVKTLIKIKLVFRSLLQAQSVDFFKATWDELSKLQDSYRQLFVEADAQGRLEDIDGLPFTLDFLVLDELDLLNQLMRAPPVQKELDAAIAQHANVVHETPWVLELMELLISYSRITQEEEGLWEIDVSLYLAEETSVSSNYTARTACGDLLIKIGEWLNIRALEGLFAYTKTLFTDAGDWRRQEASLYLFNALVSDFQEMDKQVPPEVGHAYSELVNYATNREDEPVLQARGFLAAGTLAQSYPPTANLLNNALSLMVKSESETVQVACVKAIEGFIKAGVSPDRQGEIIAAIKAFLDARDMTEMEDADDLLATLLETIRATINMDIRIALQPENQALNLLFLVAKHGAANFQVTGIVCEAFEDIARTLTDPASYTAFCTNALPLITNSIDASNVMNENPLTTVRTNMRSLPTSARNNPC